MASFTIPLWEVLELTGGSSEVVDGKRVITGGNLGLDHYPIYKPEHRAELNGKILDRYYNREIGMESISMWQLAMRRKMNEIMPYYNQLYVSAELDYEALSTVNLVTTSQASGSQVSESEGETAALTEGISKSRAVQSETPQTMLRPDEDYATAGADTNSKSNSTSEGTQSSVDNSSNETEAETTTTGYQGAASDLVMRYRESLINVDLMVLADLEELFMLVWDNGDTYTNNWIGYY